MEKNLYFIGGTSGTGKSSLIGLAMDNSEDLIVFSTGDLFSSVIGKLFNIGLSRDELKKTNWRFFEPYVISALGALIEHSRVPKVIVDSHYAVSSQSGFIPGLSRESLDYLGWAASTSGVNVCDFILIEAPLSSVYNRIVKDKTRNRRESLSMDLLEEEKESNRKFQKDYVDILSNYVATNSFEIENVDLETSYLKLREIIK